MGTRRKAREMAMQALFSMDERCDFSEEMFGRFCANFAPKPDVRPYFLRLVQGVLRTRDDLDGLIERFSENWSLGRMSGVDRNLMRIAVFELLWCRDIPAKVSINEAVDIAKKFGTEESGGLARKRRPRLEAKRCPRCGALCQWQVDSATPNTKHQTPKTKHQPSEVYHDHQETGGRADHGQLFYRGL